MPDGLDEAAGMEMICRCGCQNVGVNSESLFIRFI